jgi:molybdopterin-guanine dinucleotide biosynthesis protein A
VIPGYVLTGGASRRMGRPKALLSVGGVPLAARLARVLEEGGCTRVTLVGALPGLDALGWPVLPDPVGDVRHPLRGVLSALDDAAPGAALVVPCDAPLLAPADVAALLAHGRACEATVGGARQPLLGVFGPEHRDGLLDAIRAEASVRRAVAGRDAVVLPARAGVNINTPEDLAMLAASLGGEG